MAQIQSITVRGFKSIKALEHLELRPLNVLIGANGAGKSNFLAALRFLSEVAGDNFVGYVQKQGKAPALLHGGPKETASIEMEVYGQPKGAVSNGYRVSLEPTHDGRLIFGREETWIAGDKTSGSARALGRNHEEALVRSDPTPVARHVRAMMQSWRQYHFHDTGERAAVKQAHGSKDTLRLKPDAANLAAYLAKLRRDHFEHYSEILQTIRLVAPFFGDFVRRDDDAPTVELEWTHRDDPDTPYGAHALSDGTLRFICLATLLLQPISALPDTVLIDEPELGLHPYAVNVLADLLKQVAETRQLVVATQSVGLLNALCPQDVIVVERVGEESRFERLDSERLSGWLESYVPLGELWLRNVLGGRP